MNILIYGHRGWIGTAIADQWKKLYPGDNLILSPTRLEFSNIERLKIEIKTADRVLCCIGRTHGYNEKGELINNIDYLEDHLSENLNDNLAMPLMLAIVCKEYGVHLSYMGTGCIYSEDTWKETYEYKEDDLPDYFGSSYSVVKGVTDSFMRNLFSALNLRIRMPIVDEVHPRNFITKILSYKKICNYPNSMSYLPDMIPIMIDMIRRKFIGTYNMVNTGAITHEEILEMYREHDPSHSYEKISETELNGILKSKRCNNLLDNAKLREMYDGKVRPIKDCVRDALERYINKK